MPCAVAREISWRDNPWFPPVLREEMEFDRRRDPEKYLHIWEGGYRQSSEARVFKNWRVGGVDEFTTDANTVFYLGGDWGFAADPSVLVRAFLRGRSLF